MSTRTAGVVALLLVCMAAPACASYRLLPQRRACVVSPNGRLYDAHGNVARRCAALPQLDESRDLVLSPDGRELYVSDTDGVAVFRLDAHGLPRYLQCVTSDGSDGGCANGRGLEQSGPLALSPDGRYLDVSFGYEITPGGIATFRRSPATGRLTQIGCIGRAQRPDCQPNVAAPSSSFATIAEADNGSLVVAATDNADGDGPAIVAFRRRSDGRLEQSDCVVDTDRWPAPASIPAPCRPLSGFGVGGTLLAVAGDVYTVARDLPGITHFSVSPDGQLTLRGCEGPGSCTDDGPYGVLTLTEPLVADPARQTVYAGTQYGLFAFSRSADDGALHQVQCIRTDSYPPPGAPACPLARLDAPNALALRPDRAALIFAGQDGGVLDLPIAPAGSLDTSHARLRGGSRPTAYAMVPRGRMLYVAGRRQPYLGAYRRSP